MLCRVDENRFDAVFAVLDASFPPAEKRPYHEQKALLSEPAYTLFAAFEEAGECLGFLATWQLEDVRFIEHFAVAPSRRNQGLGACLLREYLQSSPLPTVLECELPEGELACRRIGFYERNGFVFHDYEYMQPSISAGRPPIPLRLMSTVLLSPAEFERVRGLLYRCVYHVEE